MRNPFKTRYRILEHPSFVVGSWEPQVLRWYWPTWRPLLMTTYTGHDTSPMVYETKEGALTLIDLDRTGVDALLPKIHEVP